MRNKTTVFSELINIILHVFDLKRRKLKNCEKKSEKSTNISFKKKFVNEFYKYLRFDNGIFAKI